MMTKTISKFYTVLLIAVYFVSYQQDVQAQVTTATISATDIPCCPICGTTDDLESLNCDMYELEPSSGATNFEERLWAVTWTGGVSGATTDQSYAWFYSSLGGTPLHLKIPATTSYLGSNGYLAHDADIAVGIYYDAGTTQNEYFAFIVYESNGDIYYESYTLTPSLTGVSATGPHQPLAYPAYCSPCVFGGQYLLSSGNGNASYPHVDIIYPDAAASTDGDPSAVATRYVVSWQESGDIYNAEGDLFATPSLVCSLGTGSFPDVAAVSNPNAASAPLAYDDDMIYTTYIDATAGDLVLAERKWGTATVNTTVTLQAGSGSSNTIYYPRIAAPVSYDFATTPNTEPVSLVVASVNFATTYTSVHSYMYDDPTAGTPGNTSQTISEYNANTTFSGTPYDCSMPVITGAGLRNINGYGTAGGTPFLEYPVVFYSNGTWNGITMGSGNGDLYGSNIDPGTLAPTAFYNGNFSEVNTATFYSAFDMVASPKPLLAASTSSNSNFDLLTTYWDGERIWYKDMGGVSTYTYKPGKTTGVLKTAENDIAVYPNPVSNQLNIARANGADYILMDMTGRSLVVGSITGNNASVDVTSLASGIYMLQLTKDGHTEKVKFVKQ